MPEAVTRSIRVSVRAEFAPGRSNPHKNQWFFLYTVRMTNEGRETVQLLSRHWIITDAMGDVREVRGPGVIGKQPVLEPGESFEYTSGCDLDDAVWFDARDVSDGDRRAGALRHRDSDVHAHGTLYDCPLGPAYCPVLLPLRVFPVNVLVDNLLKLGGELVVGPAQRLDVLAVDVNRDSSAPRRSQGD